MSIIRDEINKKKTKRKNTFTGSAFTYTYENELKALKKVSSWEALEKLEKELNEKKTA